MSTPEAESLDRLLASTPHLWRGRQQINAYGKTVISTGFPELDDALPGGGWPANGLVELIVPHWGVGELRVLLPLLIALNRRAQVCAWLAPPYLPYGPGLDQAALDLRYVLLINAPGNDKNLFWSMEKLLAHPGCGIVLAWPVKPSIHHLRRLQLAATEGESLAIVFQQQTLANTPTPLRLKLTADSDRHHNALNIEILKARGRLCHQSVRLVL